MRRFSMTVSVLLVTVFVGFLPVGAIRAQEDAEGRKARILANLKLQIPRLEQATITMNEITPTEFSGLEQGSFTIQGRGAQQFLVSSDDKKLWMVGTKPIDGRLSESATHDQCLDGLDDIWTTPTFRPSSRKPSGDGGLDSRDGLDGFLHTRTTLLELPELCPRTTP